MIIVLAIVIILAVAYWLFMSSYSQLFGRFPYKVPTEGKKIALTFDDGPNEPFTSQLVDYLDEAGIKATFFQVGKNVQKYPDVTKRIAQAGHQIGNHSLSHSFPKYFSEHGFETEITSTQAIFKDVLGKTPAYFRPPWLMHYPKLLKTIKKHNLQVVSGEFCHAFEVLQPSAKRITKRALAKAKPGAIIIFHDGYDAKGGERGQTVEAVKLMVPELQARGFQFVTIDELFGRGQPYL